jgi:hypothetical protein
MLERDARRLRSWQEWLGRVERNPDLVWEATPVCGAWQLQFTVHNFAPALQKVVVEQQQRDGSWLLVYELHLVEFRAFAARPRTRIKREFSVPIAEHFPPLLVPSTDSAGHGLRSDLSAIASATAEASREGRVPNAPFVSPEAYSGGRRLRDKPPHPHAAICLRLAVRGVGQVAVSHVELTDGVLRVRPAGWLISQKRILGRPAPRRGFPVVDFEADVAAIEIEFRS